MPRKTATYVTCDGPTCKEIAEVAGSDSPDNWYQVMAEKDGKYSQLAGIWEFHSLRCMEKWARMRRDALDTNHNDRSTDTLIRSTIMEAFTIEPDRALSVTEVIGITDINKSAVHKSIQSLVNQGKLVQVKKPAGPYPAKYRVNS